MEKQSDGKQDGKTKHAWARIAMFVSKKNSIKSLNIFASNIKFPPKRNIIQSDVKRELHLVGALYIFV